jgi:hypothetical protein
MKGIKKIDENLIAPYRSLTITNSSLPDNPNWQAGTLKCNTNLSGLQYKVQEGSFSYFDARYTILPNTVTSNLIEDYTIQEIDLADNCVSTRTIQKDAVTTVKILNQNVTSEKIKDHAILNKHLNAADVTDDSKRTVDYYNIRNNAVITRTILNSAVTTDKLADNSVTTKKIVNGSVTTNKIYFKAVDTDRLADEAVTWQKLGPYCVHGGEMSEIKTEDGLKIVQGKIAQETITNWNIAPETINTKCLTNGSVTNVKIGQHEVYGDAIKPQSIFSGHIAPNTITSAQIFEGGIETESYANYSVTKEKLSNDVIDVIDNAVVYDEEGNVTMLQKPSCNVYIGSEDANGKSMGNGYLRVYGDIKADRVYNMSYSDLAEGYVPGEDLEPGDIVEIRDDGKVYKALDDDVEACIVGVVSDEFAACYGATREEIEAGEKVAVALVGKVHVKVEGKIRIGQTVRAGYVPGVGTLWSPSGVTIGRALETNTDPGVKKVLCLVRPH